MDRKALFSAVCGGLIVYFAIQASHTDLGTPASAAPGVIRSDQSVIGPGVARTLVDVRRVIQFQAYVTDGEGRPVNGPHKLTFRLYDVPDAGAPLSDWTEDHLDAPVVNGLVSVVVGVNTPFPNDLMFDQRWFLEVQVDDGPVLAPRHEITPAIFAADAARSQVARRVEATGALSPAATPDVNGNLSVTADLFVGGQIIGTATNALRSVFADNGAPAGTVVAFAGPNVPAGWLLCDGRKISRVEFPALHAALGEAWGNAEDADPDTVRIPEMRGLFLRGVENPPGADPSRLPPPNFDPDSDDAARRIAIAQGGAVANHVGSLQGNATKLPSYVPFQTSAHDPAAFCRDMGSTVGNCSAQNPAAGCSSNSPGASMCIDLPAHSHSIASGGDNETRPVNVYVTWIIKY